MISAIMHPYAFSASVIVFIAAVILTVYGIKARRCRKNFSGEAR